MPMVCGAGGVLALLVALSTLWQLPHPAAGRPINLAAPPTGGARKGALLSGKDFLSVLVASRPRFTQPMDAAPSEAPAPLGVPTRLLGPWGVRQPTGAPPAGTSLLADLVETPTPIEDTDEEPSEEPTPPALDSIPPALDSIPPALDSISPALDSIPSAADTVAPEPLEPTETPVELPTELPASEEPLTVPEEQMQGETFQGEHFQGEQIQGEQIQEEQQETEEEQTPVSAAFTAPEIVPESPESQEPLEETAESGVSAAAAEPEERFSLLLPPPPPDLVAARRRDQKSLRRRYLLRHPPHDNAVVVHGGEPAEMNYEVPEEVSVASRGRVHGPQGHDPRQKFGYVVEGRNFRKYRVEERTADGFIVGEYGVLSHEGVLRGVRYTADGTISPRLIHEALVKFLSL